jgi:AcrR family transcriptional regulator
MARPIKETSRDDMIAQIKDTARSQMAARGTAGLSLRGIARELGITAPAIYNYFPTLDDLITALIGDAFQALAIAMAQAAGTHPEAHPAARIYAAGLAYRDWALAHPIQFQLIYGNPIPNYVAPAEVTSPLARRPFEGLMQDFWQAYQSGALQLPADCSDIPPALRDDIRQYLSRIERALPEALVYAIMASWARIHGIVMLELFQHITPILPHTGQFYRHELANFLRSLGMAPPDE